MSPYTPLPSEIELSTGEYLDLLAPDQTKISLPAVAHALGNICRFGGNSRDFYSVAEHAVLVANKLRQLGAPLTLQFAGLHHDDAEFALCDLPRPMKGLMGPEYAQLTDKMDLALWGAFAWDGRQTLWHTDQYTDPQLKLVDRWACLTEAKALLPSRGRNWDNVWWADDEAPIATTADDVIHCWAPNVARSRYRTKHYELLYETAQARRTFVDGVDIGAAVCYAT